MPHHLDDCDTRLKANFNKACEDAGLDRPNLSMIGVLNSSLGVIFGILGQLVYQNVNNDVPENKLRQTTIFIICVNLLIFLILRAFLRSHFCYAMWKHSPDWFMVIMLTAKNIKLLSMFLVTNFLTSAFLHEWLSSHASAIESIFVIWMMFLIFNFVQVVASK